jgi:hypothetical protein
MRQQKEKLFPSTRNNTIVQIHIFFDEKCFFIFHFSQKAKKKEKEKFLVVFMDGFSQKSIEIFPLAFPLINLNFSQPETKTK